MNCNKNIFIWREIKNWQSYVQSLMPSKVSRQIEKIIREQRDNFQYVDDPAPFKNIYSCFSDFSALVENFVTAFSDSFSHVAMFHCCRPRQIDAYYQEGIRVLSVDKANDSFKHFCRALKNILAITEKDIDAVIESMAGSYSRDGYIYFGLDDRYLIQNCGHYLIYGSEYILSLCHHMQLRIHYDISLWLKKIGVPTVFQVKIPVNRFKDHELESLAREALPAWAYCVAHNRFDSNPLDFAIMKNDTLEPEYILGHYHPESIPDPFRRGLLYRYEKET